MRYQAPRAGGAPTVLSANVTPPVAAPVAGGAQGGDAEPVSVLYGSEGEQSAMVARRIGRAHFRLEKTRRKGEP